MAQNAYFQHSMYIYSVFYSRLILVSVTWHQLTFSKLVSRRSRECVPRLRVFVTYSTKVIKLQRVQWEYIIGKMSVVHVLLKCVTVMATAIGWHILYVESFWKTLRNTKVVTMPPQQQHWQQQWQWRQKDKGQSANFIVFIVCSPLFSFRKVAKNPLRRKLLHSSGSDVCCSRDVFSARKEHAGETRSLSSFC